MFLYGGSTAWSQLLRARDLHHVFAYFQSIVFIISTCMNIHNSIYTDINTASVYLLYLFLSIYAKRVSTVPWNCKSLGWNSKYTTKLLTNITIASPANHVKRDATQSCNISAIFPELFAINKYIHSSSMTRATGLSYIHSIFDQCFGLLLLSCMQYMLH